MCGVIIFYSSFRPTAKVVLRHCLFWPEEKRLKFFVKVSDKDRTSPAFETLEENTSIVFDKDWKDLIPMKLKSGEYLIFLNR